jgi:hypothetical protein
MAIQFMAERVVMALEDEYDGARARFVIESRGPREDASVQYEFSRLFLDGTAYISATYFRDKLFPGLEFRSKEDNVTGLQIADLMARPCGEKVCAPDTTPRRWPAFRDKLVQSQETAHSILGLKVVPWEERYENLWKS